jgi:hypothetical protein
MYQARRVWELTPLHKWRIIIPFVINNLPADKPQMRNRFLRALIWGMPQFAQMIGKVVYEHTTDDIWKPLADAIPSIIPKNVEGYERVY